MKITIYKVTSILASALKRNAPVRGHNMPGGWSRRRQLNYLEPTKQSPYPGNLKDNGILISDSANHSQIVVGGPRAPYAEFTETTSFSPNWIARSEKELLDKLRQAGGRTR